MHFKVYRDRATLAATMTTDTRRYVNSGTVLECHIFHQRLPHEESRECGVARMRSHADVVISALRVSLLEVSWDGGVPGPGTTLLSITFEYCASTPIHNLLQVDAVDVDSGSIPAISILVVD